MQFHLIPETQPSTSQARTTGLQISGKAMRENSPKHVTELRADLK